VPVQDITREAFRDLIRAAAEFARRFSEAGALVVDRR